MEVSASIKGLFVSSRAKSDGMLRQWGREFDADDNIEARESQNPVSAFEGNCCHDLLSR